MVPKKSKRRRNTYLILAFFALLWLGLSVRVYFRDTSAARIYTRNRHGMAQTYVWIMRDGDGYRCVLDTGGSSILGHFKFERSYSWWGSRIKPNLKEEWDVFTLEEDFPADADKKTLIDEGYALLVAQGDIPNWPTLPRDQLKKYVVEYPSLQAKNKGVIALYSFGSTAPGLAILCLFVLVTRYVWFVAHEVPRQGVCPDCDYNLGGLTDKKCPECGRGFDDKEWRFHMSEYR